MAAIIDSAARSLADAITEYYRDQLKKRDHTALSGSINGKGTQVRYGGRSYNAILAIDLAPFDGQTVFFQFDVSRTTAIVIGA